VRDRGLILSGLLLFLALVTLPVWYSVAAGTAPGRPALALPEGKDPFGTVEEMRASHMRLLVAWRDAAVRGGERTVVGRDGKSYAKSLTGTCLGCHGRRADFCDRCHDYAAVRLACWDCHLDPAPAPRAARR
jgi:hypothetical protein